MNWRWKIANNLARTFVVLGLLIGGHAFAATPVPGDSVYQLDVQLTIQDGSVQSLAARRGRPQLVTMFYTSCTLVCPLIIDTLKLTRKAVPEPARERLDVLAVSFDPVARSRRWRSRWRNRIRRRGVLSHPAAATTPVDGDQLRLAGEPDTGCIQRRGGSNDEVEHAASGMPRSGFRWSTGSAVC